MSCAACCNAIFDKEEYLQCVMDGCSKRYHLLCAGGKHLTNEEKTIWVCPECHCAAKKGGDNSLTPVGLSKKTRDPNVTHRKKILPVNSEAVHVCVGTNNDLSVEIRSLRLEISTLRDQLLSAVSLISSYESKLDRYAQQVGTLCSKLVDYENKVTKKPQEVQSRSSPPSTSKAVVQKQVSRNTAQAKNQQATPTTMVVDPLEVSESVVKNTYPGLNSDILAPEVDLIYRDNECTVKDQQWIEVKKRKSRGPTSLYGAAGPAITTLKAAEPIKYIHLWNMASSADDIRQYLKLLCPTGLCTVDELTPRGSYKSFKIGVPEVYYDKCFSIDVWPINARIKVWISKWLC